MKTSWVAALAAMLALSPIAAQPAAGAQHDTIPFTVNMKHLPGNYRQLIVREFKTTTDYGGGIREAEISNPGPGRVGPLVNQELPTVCLRYKTSGLLRGGIHNQRIRVYYFRDGKLAGDHLFDNSSRWGRVGTAAHYNGMCAGARSYRPFPEILREVPVLFPNSR